MTLNEDGYGGTVPPIIGDENTPPTPPVTEIDYDRIISGVSERMQEAMRPQTPTTPSNATDPYEKLEEMRYNDPTAYHREVVRLATESARGQIMQEMSPALGVTRGIAYQQLTDGMDDAEKKELETMITKGLSPEAMMANPELATFARNAAYGAAQRAKTPVLRGERPGGGSETTDEQEQDLWDKNFGDWGKFDDLKKFAEKRK